MAELGLRAPPASYDGLPHGHTGGLRAALFGFCDGLVSNCCLVIGVFASITDPNDQRLSFTLLMTAVAGLTAGAASMAAGEWCVPVCCPPSPSLHAANSAAADEKGSHKTTNGQCINSPTKVGMLWASRTPPTKGRELERRNWDFERRRIVRRISMTAQEEAERRELSIERRHIMEEYDLEAEELKTHLAKVCAHHLLCRRSLARCTQLAAQTVRALTDLCEPPVHCTPPPHSPPSAHLTRPHLCGLPCTRRSVDAIGRSRWFLTAPACGPL